MILTPPSLSGPSGRDLYPFCTSIIYPLNTVFKQFLQNFYRNLVYHTIIMEFTYSLWYAFTGREMRCIYVRNRQASGKLPSVADVDPGEAGSGGWCEPHDGLRHRDRQDRASALWHAR